MIKLFKATDKIYTTNGDIVLQTTKAKVHKEDNGDFYINVEAPLSENEKSVSAIAGTTVEGTTFNLSNVDPSKEYSYFFKGQTTQEGTPTPSSPVPVETTTGNQKISIWKKNIIDFSTINFSNANNGTTTRNGSTYTVVNGSNQYGLCAFSNIDLDLQPNTTYTFSAKVVSTDATNGSSVAVGNYLNTTNTTVYGNLATAGQRSYITFTTPSTIDSTQTSSRLGLYPRTANGSAVFSELQVEIGNQMTSYEEYIGNKYEINLGKNLIKLQDRTFTVNNEINVVVSNGKITLNGTTTAIRFCEILLDNKIDWQVGKQYTVSGFNEVVNANVGIRTATTGANDVALNVVNRSLSFMQTSNVTRWNDRLTIRIASGITLDNFTITPMIMLGAYLNPTYSLYKTPIELCKIGTYQDYIFKNTIDSLYYDNTLQLDSWYIHKEVGKTSSYNGETITTDYISTTGQKTTGSTIYYGISATNTLIEDNELINQLESIRLLSGLNNISISSPNLSAIMNLKYNYRNAITTDIKYIDYLVPNNIIVANTPQGDQAFRITNVENTRTKIKIKAYHVFYDTKNYLIQDSYVVDKNCNDALDHLNSATDNTSPFTTISDITKIASYRCVRKSLYEAIQVLLERYGGHLYRDNWTIGIKNSIGQDNGVMIHYGKNLKDIKATYNWDNVVTKLMPVGKDGLLLNALEPTNDVYIESQVQYDIPYTKSITFDQSDIVEDNYKDAETGEVDTEAYTQALINDLVEQAENYLAINSVPVVNYTLSANVEKVSDIGDTIQVVDEKLGINILTNIISYEYDCVLDKYTQIEFGNFTPTLSGLIGNITNQTQQIVDESTATLQITLGQELEEATSQIWNALGNSYVIYEGDKILVVDSLPKETATNVIMINNGGIAFSNSGINGTFSSAWTIDNVLNMEQINVINLTADLVKGGTLKLGSNLNQNGQIEVYDEANSLIAELNKNGLKMYGVDGSYILMNNTVGFSGYDRLGNQIYWVSKDEFHMRKSVVEEEITLCNKLRFIPITITDSNNNIVNDGIGLVSVAGGGN